MLFFGHGRLLLLVAVYLEVIRTASTSIYLYREVQCTTPKQEVVCDMTTETKAETTCGRRAYSSNFLLQGRYPKVATYWQLYYIRQNQWLM